MTCVQHRSNGSVIVGVILLTIGFVLMLQNFNLISIDSVWSYWMVVPVIIGIVKIATMESKKDFGKGVWWIFIGMWLYISIKHVYGLNFGDTWPALIIAWGISIIWKTYAYPPKNFAKE